MLKLTDSFCRYFKAAHSQYSNIHVNTFTHFVGQKEVIFVNSVQSPIINGSLLHVKQYNSTIKNKLHYKKIVASGDETKPKKINKTMSEPWRPTMAHASYGGQFEIAENSASLEQRRRTDDGASHSRTPPAIPLDFRSWEPTVSKYDGNSFTFKVMSYNVLAQYLLECHPYLYTECAPENLTWKVRAARIFDEIITLNPDVFCLQEVQVTHLRSFYSKFDEMGYCGIYKQKTGDRMDGCAIYFKKSRFDMMDFLNVEFYQPSLPILNRDNIGLMVKLIPRGYPLTQFIVATTHLLYNPKRTDVRLAQLQVFLAEIDRFAHVDSSRMSGYLPVVLTGDLNSTPDSAVIKLLDRGRVSVTSFRDSSDWEKIGVTDQCQHLAVFLNRQEGRLTTASDIKIQNSDYAIGPPETPKESSKTQYSDMFNGGIVEHALRLASVYDKVKPDGSQEATTFLDYWGMVDYMYYGGDIRLVERLRLPTATECLNVLGKLPNHVYGSDHLALAAMFELRLRRSSL